jgi:hypothetical protein
MNSREPRRNRIRMTLFWIILGTLPCYCVGFILLRANQVARRVTTPTATQTMPVITLATTLLPVLSSTPSPIVSGTPSITPTSTMTWTPSATYTAHPNQNLHGNIHTHRYSHRHHSAAYRHGHIYKYGDTTPTD